MGQSAFQRIAIADGAGRLLVYPWKPGDLLKEICERVRFPLTPAEWKRLVPDEAYPKIPVCSTSTAP